MIFLSPPPVSAASPASPRAAILHWLAHLGPLGLFAVAVIDSSGIPLLVPGSTDLLLLWMVSKNGNPWLLAFCAVAGSLQGGYIAWSAGRRGGQAALRHHLPSRRFKSVVGWVKRHTILSVFLPAILPPPVILGPLVLASGALGVSRKRFLTVYGAARSLRYGLIAWLGVVYGRNVARMLSGFLQKWSVPLICVLAGVVVVGICLVLWQVFRRKSKTAQDSTAEAETEAAQVF